jgi:hypothetical protein
MQDTILSFLYKNYPGNYIFFLLIFKEVIMIVSMLLLLFHFILSRKFIISGVEILSLVYTAICFFYFFFSKVEGINTLSKLTTLRSLLLPVLCFIVGKWLILDLKEILTFVKIIITMGLLSVFFGFVEIMIPIEKLWLGIMDLYGYLIKVKGMSFHHFIKSVPGNFWGFIGERRMAGLQGSPLALGYYLVVPILILWGLISNNFKVNKSNFIILLVGIFFTETRMAIFAVILGFLLFKEQNFILRYRIKISLFLFLSIYFVLAFLLILSTEVKNFLYVTITFQEGRSIGHLNAIMESINIAGKYIIKGAGIGTAGAWSDAFDSRIGGLASENVYIPILVQVGGLGLFIFLLWWFNCYKRLSLKYKQEKNLFLKALMKAILVTNIGYFISGFLSEQILTFTSVAHFWLLFGILIGYKRI